MYATGIHVCMHASVHVCMRYVRIYGRMHVRMYVCMHECMRHTFVCIFDVCISVFMYLCVYSTHQKGMRN